MKSGKEIVVEFVNATNARDWDRVMSLVHLDFVRHSSSEPKEISCRLPIFRGAVI